MARNSLTMKGKKQIASLGVVAVVLLLAKFFPRVYGGLLEQTQKITRACLLYTSPSPRDGLLSRMPSSA